MLIPFAVLLSGIATTVSARRHASSSEKTFDCYPAGWVRAPDLYPGLSTPADARLYLNGTECNQIVKWEVGLRLKERAILKFAASNVTLPERPVWNESFIVRGADENSEDEPGLAPILEGGWHSTKGAEDPYHKLMEEYEKKRKDKNLWIIRAVERDVFDYKLELQLHDGSENTSTVNDFDFYAVRQFNVHVPLTNYPPQFGDGVISYSFGDDDVSEVEGMFEYYFSLTKADGDIIDVIAGQSGFLPGGHAQTASSDLQKEVTLARPDNLKPAGAPDHYDIGPWLPACDEGSDANFTVSLSIPNQGQLVSNTAYPVQVTIDKVGNGSEYPVYVKLELASCRNDTWAMGYARNGSQQAVADSCSSISEYGELTRFSLPNGRGLVRRQQPMDQICGPDPERHAEDESEEESFMMRRSMWRMAHGREKSGGKKLERDSWHLPLDLDLDVFLNATPTFQSTFFDLNNLIRVQLFTQFSCEEESAGSSITSVSDLTDDDAWAGEYRPRRPKARGYRRTHYGVIPVTVLPARLDTPGPITPYTSPEAESIVLSADAVYTGQYPLVNSTWQTEFANRDLTKYKWVSWERMPPCDHNRYCGSGGAHNTVSNAWARKSCPQYWADRREASENVDLPEIVPEGQQAFSA